LADQQDSAKCSRSNAALVAWCAISSSAGFGSVACCWEAAGRESWSTSIITDFCHSDYRRYIQCHLRHSRGRSKLFRDNRSSLGFRSEWWIMHREAARYWKCLSNMLAHSIHPHRIQCSRRNQETFGTSSTTVRTLLQYLGVSTFEGIALCTGRNGWWWLRLEKLVCKIICGTGSILDMDVSR
jgi:hypothetical protein